MDNPDVNICGHWLVFEYVCGSDFAWASQLSPGLINILNSVLMKMQKGFCELSLWIGSRI